MNGVEVGQALEMITALAGLLNGLGVSGMIGLMLLGPALVIMAILLADYQRGRKMAEMIKEARLENNTLLEAYRLDARSMLDSYREDTQTVLRSLGSTQTVTEQNYKDCVLLAKNYETIAKGLQDVVVSNTRAMERLITMLEGKGK